MKLEDLVSRFREIRRDVSIVKFRTPVAVLGQSDNYTRHGTVPIRKIDRICNEISGTFDGQFLRNNHKIHLFGWVFDFSIKPYSFLSDADKLFPIKIKFNKKRMFCFKKNNYSCLECGIRARFFAIEEVQKSDYYHLNLYGIDDKGKDRQLTIDHIIPLSKGGLDTQANYQTLCRKCNAEKGDKMETLNNSIL